MYAQEIEQGCLPFGGHNPRRKRVVVVVERQEGQDAQQPHDRRRPDEDDGPFGGRALPEICAKRHRADR